MMSDEVLLRFANYVTCVLSYAMITAVPCKMPDCIPDSSKSVVSVSWV